MVNQYLRSVAVLCYTHIRSQKLTDIQLVTACRRVGIYGIKLADQRLVTAQRFQIHLILPGVGNKCCRLLHGRRLVLCPQKLLHGLLRKVCLP